MEWRVRPTSLTQSVVVDYLMAISAETVDCTGCGMLSIRTSIQPRCLCSQTVSRHSQASQILVARADQHDDVLDV